MNTFFSCLYIFSSFFIFRFSPTEAENLALNKETRQSSTYFDLIWCPMCSYESALAVDGDRNQNTYILPGCTHTTEYEEIPWWTVDLGDTYVISGVSIYGRNDSNPVVNVRLNNFNIEVISQPCGQSKALTLEDMNNGIVSLCHYQVDSVVFMNVSCSNLMGRFVRIRFETNIYPLSLCEVEIYGAPKLPHTESFHIQDGKRIGSVPSVVLPTASLIECCLLCRLRKECTATNFNENSGQCELLDAANFNCPSSIDEEWSALLTF